MYLRVVQHWPFGTLGHPKEFACLYLVHFQETSWGMDKGFSCGQSKEAYTRSASSVAVSSRAGSTTARLPWTQYAEALLSR
jgi:hypothetical protein